MTSNLRWHHDFPRLVRKLGFKFITDKPKILIDWSSIALVDTEDIVNNRNIGALEQHINDVIYYSLQDDANILDKKFVKLFRLAQLTIEYLLFCLHYLDQGVIQLQTHICEKEQENEDLRSELVHQEKVTSKYKKKLNDLHMFFTPQMGVVNMPTIPSEIYQCQECDKQFVSEEYLKAHQQRRHSKTTDDTKSSLCFDSANTEKIISEIKELKEKLTQVEQGHHNDKISENDSMTNVLMTLLRQNSSILSTKVIKKPSTEAFTLTEPEDPVLDVISNQVINIPSIDSGVQCDLIQTDDNKENHMEMIRNELKKWKEKETMEILSQLENLKKKVYTDIEQLKAPPIPKKIEIDTERKVPSPKNLDTKPAKNGESNSQKQMEKLEHKLENNVERLFKQLTLQEREWREKINQLEQKTIPEPRTKQIEANNLHQTSSVATQKDIDLKNDTRNIIQSPNCALQSKSSTLPKPSIRKAELPRVHFNSRPQLNVNSSLNKNVDYSSSTPSSPLVSPKATSKPTKLKSNQRRITRKEAPVLVTSKIGDIVDDGVKEANVTVKPSQSTLGRHSVSSLKEAVFCDPHFLSEFKETMLELVQSSLREIGVDPEWKQIPKPMLEKHISTMNHFQSALVEKHPDYYQIKRDIVTEINAALKKDVVHLKTETSKPKRPGFPPFSIKRHFNEPKKNSRFSPVATHQERITVMDMAAKADPNPILSEINDTVQKMKNKMVSVFKHESKEKNQSKDLKSSAVPTKQITEGIYKLTVITEDGSPKKMVPNKNFKVPIARKRTNVPVKNREILIEKLQETEAQRETNNINPSIPKIALESSSREKIEKLASILSQNDSIQSSIRTISNTKDNELGIVSCDSSSSESVSQQTPRQDSHAPTPISPTKPSPLTRLNMSMVSPSESNSLSQTNRQTSSKSLSSQRNKSMYDGGDVTDSESSERTRSTGAKQSHSHQSQNDNISKLESPKKTASFNYNSSSTAQSSPEIIVPAKKKVLFDLQSETTSATSKIENPFLSKFETNVMLSTKDNIKSNSTTPASLHQTEQSASVFVKSSRPVVQGVDNGDTTSISSSVFDGSKLNLEETEYKNSDEKTKNRTNEIEELILSDFDYSSGES